MIEEASIIWDDWISLALWAYRTTKSTTTKQTPFSLVYRAKSVLPVEIKVMSARMLLSSSQEGNPGYLIWKPWREKESKFKRKCKFIKGKLHILTISWLSQECSKKATWF